MTEILKPEYDHLDTIFHIPEDDSTFKDQYIEILGFKQAMHRKTIVHEETSKANEKNTGRRNEPTLLDDDEAYSICFRYRSQR